MFSSLTVTIMEESMPAVEPAAAIPAFILPIRRDLHFKLPSERVGDWHNEGPHVSHFFNALSLFFPDGERFFIHAVRHYRAQIVEPQLQQAVTAFIGQEAKHGRERSEEHTSELQSLMRNSYAVFCLKKKKNTLT